MDRDVARGLSHRHHNSLFIETSHAAGHLFVDHQMRRVVGDLGLKLRRAGDADGKTDYHMKSGVVPYEDVEGAPEVLSTWRFSAASDMFTALFGIVTDCTGRPCS